LVRQLLSSKVEFSILVRPISILEGVAEYSSPLADDVVRASKHCSLLGFDYCCTDEALEAERS